MADITDPLWVRMPLALVDLLGVVTFDVEADVAFDALAAAALDDDVLIFGDVALLAAPSAQKLVAAHLVVAGSAASLGLSA